LGRQYGTLCSALAVAERQRNAGRHTLVVLDDISCMVRHPYNTAAVACAH
jgi:F0F1-type ATP synthase alpha subunit